jgi:SAM-dependent methyltransferase
MSAGSDGTAYWDGAYAEGEDAASWFQAYPTASLKMLDAAGVGADDSVIDVGAGAARFVDALISRGFRDVTVLDISSTGMGYAQRRLGRRAQRVQWVVADLLTWQPPRRYRAWHDRAVFHFLTSQARQSQYLDVLEAATEPDSVAVFGLFAPDGPEKCSGLPVARYSVSMLADRLGAGWQLVCEDREEHTTPKGRTQPFTWAALRKQPTW